MLLLAGSLTASAQNAGQSAARVQLLSGKIDPGGTSVYLLQGLVKDQRLYVYAEASPGNLDPLVYLLPGDTDLLQFQDQGLTALQAALQAPDPIAEINRLRDELTLAWNDDGGKGYSATLEWTVPESGDYYLLVGGSLSSVGRQTLGATACWLAWMNRVCCWARPIPAVSLSPFCNRMLCRKCSVSNTWPFR